MTEQVREHAPLTSPREYDEAANNRIPKNTGLVTKQIRKRTRTLSGHANPYPRLDIEIRVEDDIDVQHKLVKEVARRFIPRWEEVPDELMAIKQYSGGLTNKLFRVGVDEHRILIRVYGGNTDQMIDRESEIVIIQQLHNQGLSARFYGTYLNGCGYGHVEGRALNINDLIHNERIRNIVASHIGRFHAVVDVPQLERKPALFHTMHKWIDKFLREGYGIINEDHEKELKNMNIDLKQEVLLLEKELLPLGSPVIFCHNDLTPGNIILDEELDTVTFIDHEYACFNFRGFELGNHFCEFIGFDIDMSKYPPKETQMPFLKAYLESFLKETAKQEREAEERQRQFEEKGETRQSTMTDEKEELLKEIDRIREEYVTVTEEMVEQLYVEVNKYSLASHLHWGIWGLAQARISTIDFDYFTYAKKRLDSYVQMKDKMLSLTAPNAK